MSALVFERHRSGIQDCTGFFCRIQRLWSHGANLLNEPRDTRGVLPLVGGHAHPKNSGKNCKATTLLVQRFRNGTRRSIEISTLGIWGLKSPTAKYPFCVK